MSDFIIRKGVLIRYTGKNETVVVPERVRVIGPHPFIKCRSLKKLILNEGLEYFDEACLDDLNRVKENQFIYINIPSTVKEIKLADIMV